jgi:hypothetical protein
MDVHRTFARSLELSLDRGLWQERRGLVGFSSGFLKSFDWIYDKTKQDSLIEVQASEAEHWSGNEFTFVWGTRTGRGVRYICSK